MDIEVPLQGEYADMRRLIHTLETAPEFLVIRDVELAKIDQGEQLGADAEIEPDHVLPGSGWSSRSRVRHERERQAAGLEAAGSVAGRSRAVLGALLVFRYCR